MDYQELCAKQQLDIENLKEVVDTHKKAIASVDRELFCIGGPLNGNKLNYSPVQLKTFHRIYQSISDLLD